MEQALRAFLLIALGAAALTTAAVGFSWWMEDLRRLRRALRRVLGAPPEAEAMAPTQGRAAGLEFGSESVAVLWDKGGSGLVYGFDELEGAELIVDGAVCARVRRGEPRRELDQIDRDAERVTLRLIFADARFPEFELELWGPGLTGGEGPADAVRAGRRWLAHVEAVLRRPPRPAAVAAPDEEADGEEEQAG